MKKRTAVSFPLDDNQFGLQDLMKNQELQIVTESVLQNVDQDFSESEINVHVSDVKSQDEVVQCPFEIFKEIDPLGSLPFIQTLTRFHRINQLCKLICVPKGIFL
jgi:hypothetical protein